jgi:hypothetical protein
MKLNRLLSTRRRKLAVGGAAAVVLAASGVGVANAISESDHEQPANGPQVAQAKATALRIAAGGSVSEVQHDGENGGNWVVDVSRPDGSLISIQLDSTFKQVPFDTGSDPEGHGGR